MPRAGPFRDSAIIRKPPTPKERSGGEAGVFTSNKVLPAMPIAIWALTLPAAVPEVDTSQLLGIAGLGLDCSCQQLLWPPEAHPTGHTFPCRLVQDSNIPPGIPVSSLSSISAWDVLAVEIGCREGMGDPSGPDTSHPPRRAPGRQGLSPRQPLPGTASYRRRPSLVLPLSLSLDTVCNKS